MDARGLTPTAAAPVDVCFVVLPETLLLDLAGPAEAFRLANQALARQGRAPLWRLRHVGPDAQVRSSVGLQLAGLEPLPERFERPTWVFLLGRPGDAAAVVRDSRPWLTARDWLGRVLGPALAEGPRAHRLLTVCSGALLAADAGLLTGRCTTTHHELLEDLARMAPAARVLADRVFVDDGNLLSSAGVTAGIDLALHCIARHAGEALAAEVAQVLVVFHRRGAGDPERSPLLAGRSHLHPALHRVQNAVGERPAEDWTLERLAAEACVTPRHLGRLFAQHVGCTPRDHVERVRSAFMREALAAGWPLGQALGLAGFRSDRQWRRARARGERSAPSAHSSQADAA
ncbi:MAG TPA: DJ-1/PfpI family protein [Burkholderiaceae bacterium]|nr:DJ-1/PfpI family protein [Burkholderiaceae bacterium]HNG81744.1 DJ-1/PfpI family protein [Burkholderiaceae bacterium]